MSDYLKIIAALTMFIDHIGAFTGIAGKATVILRMIGRISFPIYAYSIATGYVHTKNLKKYFLRLIITAVISAPIYYYISSSQSFIFFTLIYTLLILFVYDKVKKPLAILMIALSYFIPYLDYGLYGVITIFVFYIFKDDEKKIFLSLLVINIIFYLMGEMIITQSLSLLSLVFIFQKNKPEIKINNKFFYVFYPLHLIVIAIMATVEMLVRLK